LKKALENKNQIFCVGEVSEGDEKSEKIFI